MLYGKKVVFMAGAAAAAMSLTTVMDVYAADATFDMRRDTVRLLGIINTKTPDESVTRQEFARMLVKCSSYSAEAGISSNVSVFADVPKTGEYASDIRIAADNGWMTGYLGGNFEPEEGILMRDAIRATLALLGYSNNDFDGNLTSARRAKFSSLSLDSNIYRDDDEVLTYSDCINLFYNLMKADAKNGGKYGSQIFDLTYNSDGEVNMSSILDNSLVGPKVLNYTLSRLKNVIPFPLSTATMFLDGESCDEYDLADSAVVVYYHEATKMVFGYSSDSDNKGASKGRIREIYYDSTDPFTPVQIKLNSSDQDTADGYDVFNIKSSEIAYLFSVFGEYGVGDDVAVVWEKSGNDENATYTIVDVVGY